MKKLFYIPLFILFVAFAFTFSIRNQEALNSVVDLSYYGGFDKSVPLIVLLAVTLLVGVLIGWLAMGISLIKSKRQASKAKKQLAKAEKEVENLRAMPIKDEV